MDILAQECRKTLSREDAMGLNMNSGAPDDMKQFMELQKELDETYSRFIWIQNKLKKLLEDDFVGDEIPISEYMKNENQEQKEAKEILKKTISEYDSLKNTLSMKIEHLIDELVTLKFMLEHNIL